MYGRGVRRQHGYGLSEAFTKIRSFVFVSDLGDVSSVLQDGDVNSAIESALEGGGVINVYTRSNFGYAFHDLLVLEGPRELSRVDAQFLDQRFGRELVLLALIREEVVVRFPEGIGSAHNAGRLGEP